MEARNAKDLRKSQKSAKWFHAQSIVSSANGLNGLPVTRSVVLVCRSVIDMRQSRKNMVVSFVLVPPLRIRSAWTKSAQLIAKFPIGGKRHHVTRLVVVVSTVRSRTLPRRLHMEVPCVM
jgi:hypothetical protein